jgi:hypothetical protein
MDGKKIHLWVQEYPFFKREGCGIAMVRHSVYVARCGSSTYRKGRSYLDVKLRDDFCLCSGRENKHVWSSDSTLWSYTGNCMAL